MNLSMIGYIENIEKETLSNSDFRRVIFTGKHSQLVLMTLNVGEEIGTEIHYNVDQFIRIEKGEGKLVMNGEETIVKEDFAFVVPEGVEHNLINIGNRPLQLYSVYSPPNHPENTIHHTKNEADLAEQEEHQE